jgi:tripartite-type tricarboxylate transporter receptor subunit TctC
MSLSYDVLNDFAPVALLPTQPLLIVARKSLAARNLKELIAWLKSNPDKPCKGTPASARRRISAASSFRSRPIRVLRSCRTGDAGFDRRQLDLMFDPAGSAVPYLLSGSIKAMQSQRRGTPKRVLVARLQHARISVRRGRFDAWSGARLPV